MKKVLFSWALVVVMIFTMAFASSETINLDNVITKFLDETDLKTNDIAIQFQYGDNTAEAVIRPEEDGTVHLAIREDGKETGHVQLNTTGIYVGSKDAAVTLKYATVTDVIDSIVKAVDEAIDKAVESIPESELPTEAEVKDEVNKVSAEVYAAFAQEEADAATLSAAAADFATRFRPEYILDVKEENGSVEISLRTEAFAVAMADAVDGLMSNEALGKLVDREAAETNGKTFAEYQAEWLANREATLEAIRTLKDTGKLEDNGHWTAHFQVGENTEESRILVSDTDAWFDAESGEMQMIITLGVEDQVPYMVYEAEMNPNFYKEKLTSGNSLAEVTYTANDGKLTGGRVRTVLEGLETLRAEFGTDYLYVKGLKGSLSTTVRETWTGKIRCELIAETAEGGAATMVFDFYNDGDSLVCEMKVPGKMDHSLLYKISRIEKTDIDDLSASEKITEITAEDIGNLLKLFFNAEETAATEAGK